MKREEVNSIKGCQKKVVLIRSAKSPIFEEAYLIMREQEEAFADADIVSEADRILKECTVRRQKRRQGLSRREFLFFLGGLGVTGFFGGLALLLVLLLA